MRFPILIRIPVKEKFGIQYSEFFILIKKIINLKVIESFAQSNCSKANLSKAGTF